jgi:hypothetical protein
MISYETYCKIRDHRERQGLTITPPGRWVYTPRRSRSGRASTNIVSNQASSAAAGSMNTRG